MIDKNMCSTHGYGYIPNDEAYYLVLNPPAIDKSKLCGECTKVMKQREIDYPDFKGCKVWFNITSDQTQRKLMLGRYVYLRLRSK